MLRSKLASSFLQIFAQLSLPGKTRSRRLKLKQRRCGTEQLEVRQLLTGDFESAVRFGSTGLDNGTAITTDASGNVYTTGHFSGTVDFNPGAAVTNLVSAGSTDIFVTKVDSAGNLLWAKRMGGAGDDQASSLALDSLGNIYAAGSFNGTSDFDPGTTVRNLTCVGIKDAFLLRLNSIGDYVWVKRFGGVGSEVTVNAVKIDRSGNVCSVGSFTGTADFDPGSAVKNLTSAGETDVFVSRMSNSGTSLLAKSWGSTSTDYGADIALDDANNILTTGFFMGNVDFDPGTSTVNHTSAGLEDAFISKLDSAGTLIWVKRIGADAVDIPRGIVVDKSGNIYVAGGFKKTVDFDPGSGVQNLVSSGNTDGFLTRLNSGGNFVWAKRMDGVPTDIAVDDSGNVYLTGSFRGSFILDTEDAQADLSSAGGLDVFVVKFDNAGKIRWGSQTGGTLNDNVGEIAVDRTGSVYTIGSFSGVSDFDPGIGVTNLTSAGGSDIFVSKLSPDMLYTHADGVGGELRLLRNGALLELWFKGTFTFGEFVLMETHALASIRSVKIKGSNTGNNVLTLDFAAGGSFVVDQGIQYSAGTSGGDVLQLIGMGNEGFAYRPSTVAGTGKFLTYGKELSFTGIEFAGVAEAQALSVEPQGSADVLTVGTLISLNGPMSSQITGTTSGVSITPLLFSSVRDLTIDTGLFDGTLAQSTDTVTFNAGSYEAKGLKNVFVRTGKGNDTLRVNSADLGLPESGGSFWYLSGAGSDLLQTVGDANWDLSDVRLVSSGGGRLQFDETERVSITGGISNNHINAMLFTGAVILDGGGGNDLLRGGAGSDTLSGGLGNDRLWGGGGDDVLHGQDGHDSVWGEDGLDTLNGDAGNDQLWGGNNDDIINGEDGDDELWGGNGNDQLDGGSGGDQLFGEAGRDTLNGGSDMDLLDGGSGNDTLSGDGGIDLYVLQGTENTDELWLDYVSATRAFFRRRPRGLVSTLELDTITMDASDEFQILALGGDDSLLVDSLFTQLGQLDGGLGDDISNAPTGWAKVSC